MDRLSCSTKSILLTIANKTLKQCSEEYPNYTDVINNARIGFQRESSANSVRHFRSNSRTAHEEDVKLLAENEHIEGWSDCVQRKSNTYESCESEGLSPVIANTSSSGIVLGPSIVEAKSHKSATNQGKMQNQNMDEMSLMNRESQHKPKNATSQVQCKTDVPVTSDVTTWYDGCFVHDMPSDFYMKRIRKGAYLRILSIMRECVPSQNFMSPRQMESYITEKKLQLEEIKTQNKRVSKPRLHKRTDHVTDGSHFLSNSLVQLKYFEDEDDLSYQLENHYRERPLTLSPISFDEPKKIIKAVKNPCVTPCSLSNQCLMISTMNLKSYYSKFLIKKLQ